MRKFKEDAGRLLELAGGKGNIVSFTHCATRMRFVLADDAKADVKGIEELGCVKGTFTQGGQFQVILGFRNVIGDIKLLENGTRAITEVHPFWNGVHSFLWLIGEAIFVFLPVSITYSVCKKMNSDPVLGIVLGVTLVSPQLMSASDFVTAVSTGEAVKAWDFGAFQINMVGYQSQVIPAILVGIVFSIIYRFLKKRVPEMISMIVVQELPVIQDGTVIPLLRHDDRILAYERKLGEQELYVFCNFFEGETDAAFEVPKECRCIL